MTVQEVEDWVNAAIFAHDSTDGAENWGNLHCDSDMEHHLSWLQKYKARNNSNGFTAAENERIDELVRDDGLSLNEAVAIVSRNR